MSKGPWKAKQKPAESEPIAEASPFAEYINTRRAARDKHRDERKQKRRALLEQFT